MFAHVRKVWVVQQRSTGLFLNDDLHFTRSLRRAGRCYDAESASETGRWNLGEDYEVFSFLELDPITDKSGAHDLLS